MNESVTKKHPSQKDIRVKSIRVKRISESRASESKDIRVKSIRVKRISESREIARIADPSASRIRVKLESLHFAGSLASR